MDQTEPLLGKKICYFSFLLNKVHYHYLIFMQTKSAPSDKKGITAEEEEQPMLVKKNQKNDRTYNLGYLLRLTLMAAIGGFLFG